MQFTIRLQTMMMAQIYADCNCFSQDKHGIIYQCRESSWLYLNATEFNGPPANRKGMDAYRSRSRIRKCAHQSACLQLSGGLFKTLTMSMLEASSFPSKNKLGGSRIVGLHLTPLSIYSILGMERAVGQCSIALCKVILQDDAQQRAAS